MFARVHVEVPIQGLMSTISGRGRADVIRTGWNENEVYEIKSITATSSKGGDPEFMAAIQLHDYIHALNAYPELGNNRQFSPATEGTSLLKAINGRLLPFPDGSNRCIRIITIRNKPGMIYYDFLECKGDEEYAYEYSDEDKKTWEYIINNQHEYADPLPSPVLETEADMSFYLLMNSWLQSNPVSYCTSGNSCFIKVSFPDGSSVFRYDGNYTMALGKSPQVTYDTLKTLYDKHIRGEYLFPWYPTMEDAYRAIHPGLELSPFVIPLPGVFVPAF